MRRLLDGRLAKEARSGLAALSARMLRVRIADASDASLAGGTAGLALAHASLASFLSKSRHHGRAQQALDATMDLAGRAPIGPGLFSGLAGIGWVTGTLAEADDDACALVDRALVHHVERAPRHAPFDLVDGLVGVGVYGLERTAHRAGQRILRAVVDRLGEAAVRSAAGIAWRGGPDAAFDLGVAHGVPGIIAWLGRVLDADVDASLKASARALLEPAVAWLLSRELSLRSRACFAAAVVDGLRPKSARLAWCYGDAGIAAALLVAARGARREAWAREAVRIGLRAIARTETSSRVRDAGLCHGAAGVAHVFHRLYDATDDARFADASRLWFARALAMPPPTDEGFLTGVAGVALALSSALGDVEPTWHRPLLLP